MSVSDLIRQTFLAYNGARLREACRLLAEQMLSETGTVGLSLSGALTPAGVGISCLVPLLRGGYVDWLVSTGANLYHDTHFSLDLNLHHGSHLADDFALRKGGMVRIYDIILDYADLLSTDKFYREMITSPSMQRSMSSAEFHHLAGQFARERETALGVDGGSVLSAAHDCGVPVYTSSPGDSAIGMQIAGMALEGNRLVLDPNQDVNETAAIAYNARQEGTSGVWILGGGSPKNFMLQTEPHLQDILGVGLMETGFDFFLQITDARPDTGGLSGATPSEAASWGKIGADRVPGTVVAYCDSTIALPLLTAYILENVAPRPLKRLYDRREELLETMRDAHLQGRVSSMLPEGIKPGGRKEGPAEEGSGG
jgi:deoxyhypusine synthase